MKIFPKTPTANILVQELESELLIYDLQTNKAFCLNETSAMVYQLCDGKNSIADISSSIARKLHQPINNEMIWLALDGLKKENLLEESKSFAVNFNGLTRRQVIKKVGLASMIALPLVSSIVAPNAAMAQSGTNLPLNAACTTPTQCVSGNCVNGSTCCSPTSTGTEAPRAFLGLLDGPPNSTCASYSPSQQLADCSGVYGAASCCNGIIVVGNCSFDGNSAFFSCRCGS